MFRETHVVSPLSTPSVYFSEASLTNGRKGSYLPFNRHFQCSTFSHVAFSCSAGRQSGKTGELPISESGACPVVTYRYHPAAKKPTVWGSAPAMICTGRLIQPEDPLYTSRSSAMVECLPVNRIELLQGTLDLMILQTLRWGPHGHGIGQAIRVSSQDAIQVEHGSLYPALHRLERRGWLAAEWKISEANRRARYYRLTPRGRKRLLEEQSKWRALVRVVAQTTKTIRG